MPAQLFGKPKAEVDQERIIGALERMALLLAQIARGVDRLVEDRAKPQRDDALGGEGRLTDSATSLDHR
jgi:hypothetical protein